MRKNARFYYVMSNDGADYHIVRRYDDIFKAIAARDEYNKDAEGSEFSAFIVIADDEDQAMDRAANE